METKTGNGHGVTLEKLMADLKVVINDGQKLIQTGAGQLRQKAIAGAKATDESIRRNPYPSIGILFGLGLVLGILSSSLFKSAAQSFEEEEG